MGRPGMLRGPISTCWAQVCVLVRWAEHEPRGWWERGRGALHRGARRGLGGLEGRKACAAARLGAGPQACAFRQETTRRGWAHQAIRVPFSCTLVLGGRARLASSLSPSRGPYLRPHHTAVVYAVRSFICAENACLR